MLPELDYDVASIAATCRRREERQRYTIICIGEGAKQSGDRQTVQAHVPGSPDPVRLGGVGHVLREQLQPYLNSEVRTTVLGHVQRGGDPTPYDRVLATRLGAAAVRLAAAGGFGRMVALQGGRITDLPLAEALSVPRRVDPLGDMVHTARGMGICLGD